MKQRERKKKTKWNTENRPQTNESTERTNGWASVQQIHTHIYTVERCSVKCIVTFVSVVVIRLDTCTWSNNHQTYGEIFGSLFWYKILNNLAFSSFLFFLFFLLSHKTHWNYSCATFAVFLTVTHTCVWIETDHAKTTAFLLIAIVWFLFPLLLLLFSWFCGNFVVANSKFLPFVWQHVFFFLSFPQSHFLRTRLCL